MVLGAEQTRDLAQEATAAARREVSDRPAEEGHDAWTDRWGHMVQVALEVPDHAMDLQARILGGQGLGALAHHALRDIHRDVALERSRRAQGVQQYAGLRGGPRAELHELDRAGQLGQLLRAFAEDPPLAA